MDMNELMQVFWICMWIFLNDGGISNMFFMSISLMGGPLINGVGAPWWLVERGKRKTVVENNQDYKTSYKNNVLKWFSSVQ